MPNPISLRIAAILIGALAASGSQAASLKEFLDGVAALPPGSDVQDSPAFAEALDRSCCRQPSEETSEALRSLEPALARGGPVARVYILSVLLELSHRADREKLMNPHFPAVLSLLYDQDARVQALALMVICNGSPAAWQVATPALLRYLDSGDPSANSKAGAVGALLTFAPPDPRIWPAVEKYASRGLGETDKAALLHSLALARDEVTDEPVVRMVIASLNDPHEAVRFQAADALSQWASRWGWGRLASALPPLRAMEADPSENANVRATARKALSAAGPRQR